MKPVLYALGSIVVGGVLFALTLPLLFPNADPEKLGRLSAPVILFVFGGIGLALGFRAVRKKSGGA